MNKLLFYIGSMQLGGANRVMANLTNYFSSMGKCVILVNDIRTSAEKQEYEIALSVKRIFLSERIINDENRFTKNIKRIKALRKILNEEKPDIVVSFMGSPNERILIATIGMDIRTVVSVRSDPYKEYGRGLKRILANILFSTADGCVFQTDEAARYFINRIRKKSRIIFNPVNPEFYCKQHKEENNHIVVVGRLHPQKNPMLILNAFAEINKKFPQCELDFLGSGELEQKLINKTKTYGLVNKVHFKGQVKDIAEQLSSASVYVLCSDCEGMPNALMEAMAVGIPVIATDCPCGGPRKLITNRKQGILVPCNDVKEMVRALDNILSSKELRKKLSIGERKRAEQFHPDIVFKEWETYLGNMMNRRNQ